MIASFQKAHLYTQKLLVVPFGSFSFQFFKKNLSISRKHNQVGDKAFSVKMPNRVLVSFKFLP